MCLFRQNKITNTIGCCTYTGSFWECKADLQNTCLCLISHLRIDASDKLGTVVLSANHICHDFPVEIEWHFGSRDWFRKLGSRTEHPGSKMADSNRISHGSFIPVSTELKAERFSIPSISGEGRQVWCSFPL